MLNQMQRFGLILGFILGAATVAFAGPDDNQKPENLARARLDIARRAYEHAESSIMNPPTDDTKLPSGIRTTLKLEQLVAWSRRWMEAERDISGKKADHLAALDAHRKRLQRWEDVYSEIDKDVDPSNFRHVDLLKFHRLEAEYWLATVKDDR